MMTFAIEFTHSAADHVRALRKFEQQLVLDTIEQQLRHEPLTETRNKKRLGPNDLCNWELRVGRFRVFYDLVVEVDPKVVKIKSVGYKEHNKLYIGGKETVL
jgi:mRNA-degrading endonuclease RelE of RelBE toxin-antitoxin system